MNKKKMYKWNLFEKFYRILFQKSIAIGYFLSVCKIVFMTWNVMIRSYIFLKISTAWEYGRKHIKSINRFVCKITDIWKLIRHTIHVGKRITFMPMPPTKAQSEINKQMLYLDIHLFFYYIKCWYLAPCNIYY